MAASIISTLTNPTQSRSASPWVTSSLTLAAGDRVLVFGASDNPMGTVTLTLSSSGPSFTQINFAEYSFGNGGTRGVWISGEMPNATSRTLTFAWTSGENLEQSGLIVLVVRGIHATVPYANNTISSVGETGGKTVSITPTSIGSLLFMLTSDPSMPVLAAAANCSATITDNDVSRVVLIQPTTQPRVDTNAFSIGYTVTSGSPTVGWLALEIQGAASSGSVDLGGSAVTPAQTAPTMGLSIPL